MNAIIVYNEIILIRLKRLLIIQSFETWHMTLYKENSWLLALYWTRQITFRQGTVNVLSMEGSHCGGVNMSLLLGCPWLQTKNLFTHEKKLQCAMCNASNRKYEWEECRTIGWVLLTTASPSHPSSLLDLAAIFKGQKYILHILHGLT